MPHLSKLLLLLVLSPLALASSKIPADLAAFIQEKQPFIQIAFFEMNDCLEELQKKFPLAHVDGRALVFKSKGNEAVWRFNEKNKVISLFLKFDLKGHKADALETQLLKSYRHELTSDKLAALPGGQRSLVVSDQEKGIDLVVYFPLSDTEPPRIRSITIKKRPVR